MMAVSAEAMDHLDSKYDFEFYLPFTYSHSNSFIKNDCLFIHVRLFT